MDRRKIKVSATTAFILWEKPFRNHNYYYLCQVVYVFMHVSVQGRTGYGLGLQTWGIFGDLHKIVCEIYC